MKNGATVCSDATVCYSATVNFENRNNSIFVALQHFAKIVQTQLILFMGLDFD